MLALALAGGLLLAEGLLAPPLCPARSSLVLAASASLRSILRRRRQGRSRVRPESSAGPARAEEDDGLGPQDEEFRSGFVSILGNPNVGKSTLLNAMLRERLSIVSPKPQTTRHRILGILSEPRHQIIFSDTPGMLRPAYKLQDAMMDTVRGAASDADAVLLVSDVFGEPLADDKVFERLRQSDRPVVVVVNKVDLVMNVSRETNASHAPLTTLRPKRAGRVDGEAPTARSLSELREIWAERLPQAEVLGVSAALGYNVSALVGRLVELLPRGPRYFPEDTLTNRDERFFAAEIIREALFYSYRDELPYSCEVRIADFKDKSERLSVVEAEIVVDKESKKLILIGRAGEKLKALGTMARLRLEEFLQRKVFLSLRVKVDSDWRHNSEALERFGYTNSDFG